MAVAGFDLGAGYDTAMQSIAAIDEQLDALTDSKGAGKRAHVNTLVTAQADNVAGLITNLTSKLGEADDEVVVGFVTGLLRQLKSTFDDRINAYVENWAKANIPDENASAVTLSDEEIKNLEAQRSEYYKMVKTLRELAVQLQIVSEDERDSKMPMPKKRTGSRGARGPQVWSLYLYTVNGAELEDDPSLTEIAKANGFEKRTELTNFIKSVMGDSWKPGDNFEVTLPNDNVLEGTFPTGTDVPEEEPEAE